MPSPAQLKSTPDQNESEAELPSPLFVIAGVFVLCTLGLGLLLWAFDTWQDRALFGDSFGAVNALFSGLALAGVVYAILLQRRELALQREELADTRAELRRAADAQEGAEELARVNLRLAALTAVVNAQSTRVQKATGGTPAAEMEMKQLRTFQRELMTYVRAYEEGGHDLTSSLDF